MSVGVDTMTGFRFLVIWISYRLEYHIIEELRLECASQGIQILEVHDQGNFLFNQFIFQGKAYPLENCLFLTDQGNFVDQIQLYGGFPCVYLNAENQDQDFFHVPYVLDGLEGLTVLDLTHIYQRYAKTPWTILETERLRVREMTVEDLKSLYLLYDDEQVQKFVGLLYEDPDEELAYMEQYIETVYPFFGYGMWIVEEKETGMTIGRAGFNFREFYEGMELGYLIGKEFRNKGYATEVCRAIVDYVKEEFHPDEIRSLTTKDNSSSKKVLEKVGFRYIEDVELDGKILEKFCIS